MKYKIKKPSKQTLSDKIADSLTLKPRADIEDDHIFGSKPNTVSRVDYSSSDEDDATISDFRKQNINLLSDISKKYEGEVVSKKDSEEEAEDSLEDSENDIHGSNEHSKQPSDEGDESDDYSITKFQKQLQSDSDAEPSNSGTDDGSDNDDDGGEGYDISQLEEPIKENFEHIKKQDVSEEAKKGICVRNQLLLWEGLLEMRIHLQRCINTANMMPMNDIYEKMKNKNDFVEESNATIRNVSTLLEKFITLQNLMLSKFPETKALSANAKLVTNGKQKNEESDEEIPSDTDNEEIPSDTESEKSIGNNKINEAIMKKVPKKRKLEDFEKEIVTAHKKFKQFRDSTIQKWNEKTRIATAANIKTAPTNTILQQISFILSDREKLIKRTQLKRSEYEIIGYKKEESKEVSEINPTTKNRKDDDEYIMEIFDDSDFYHQLLRELIECKSADITDPVQLSRQWISLQQMRSKMKRKVDTKATKGRKIKYVVHNPLVSYMASEKGTKWNDESTNELYSSLFGKLFEHNNVGLNVDLDNNK
ncbi:unnamed protein product [Pieris macdunnoughi]|uniref:Protein AATF n=1 Tax=Pieris macdunnoughi TaxID=345717 RepID=A0A821PPE6_9NEOP|nr:unnamed protein product [Pieris macdunnoughi]